MKFARPVCGSIAAGIVGLLSAIASHAESPWFLRAQSDTATTNTCGGYYFSSTNRSVCCYADQSVQCDNTTGECWCELTPACQTQCSDRKDCGTQPICPTNPPKSSARSAK